MTKITVAGKTLTIDELGKLYADLMLGGCLADIDHFNKTVATTVAASEHNADLLQDISNGTDFRIAFRMLSRPGWTRIMFAEEALLQKLALEEVTIRQEVAMTDLADMLGVDKYRITFGD